MIAAGEVGPLHYVHGAYLQDWLLEATDFSWRLEPEKGGSSSAIGDIGSHWCDLVEHVTGHADPFGALRFDDGDRQAAEAAGIDRGVREGATRSRRARSAITAEDLATVLLRFEGGAKGCVSVGQVCAGHKNGLWFEVNGRKTSLRWKQEQQNELWIGRAAPGQQRARRRIRRCSAGTAQRYAHLPGRPSGRLAGRVLQCAARRLRLHRRAARGRSDRARRRFRRSKTATARRASSKRF